MEEDDLSNMDIMPPPIFSKTVVPHLYKYSPIPSQFLTAVTNKTPA
jgi:hypothetical protein